jgi:hypothetical protein
VVSDYWGVCGVVLEILAMKYIEMDVLSIQEFFRNDLIRIDFEYSELDWLKLQGILIALHTDGLTRVDLVELEYLYI